jgi:O-methyltransferase
MNLRGVALLKNLIGAVRRPAGPAPPSIGLYLDLMKLCLTDSIYGNDDPGPDPMDERYDATIRLRGTPEGTNWPSHAHTMVGLPRLNNIQFCVESILADGVQGDLIETGVWRGGATILMRAILKAHDVRDRAVWVADSFKGLPPPDTERYPADAGLHLEGFAKLAVSLQSVRDNFARYGLLDDQVQFVEGLFEDTLPPANLGQLALLRLDGDLYGSTWVALERLYPKLVRGGYLIVDDYGAIEPCRMAVHDYRDKHGIHEPIERIDFTGVYWRRQ